MEATASTDRYQALDDAICKHLQRGIGHPTDSMQLEALARSILMSGQRKRLKLVAWRLIDRRLQAMRKAGRIAFIRNNGERGHWIVSTTSKSTEA